jgi:hypothetical protein
MSVAPGSRGERWGALVVRVWVDDGDCGDGECAIRAHVSQSLDVSQDEYAVGLARSVDEVAHTVREWVEEFVRGEVDTAVMPDQRGGDGEGAGSAPPAVGPRRGALDA